MVGAVIDNYQHFQQVLWLSISTAREQTETTVFTVHILMAKHDEITFKYTGSLSRTFCPGTLYWKIRGKTLEKLINNISTSWALIFT